ncbi:inositol-trisphosphate 3-kinase-like protein isoform X2 [Nomia melanderi]|uniref:inositol-trisphosphate 3-kinase-like protein isoform X2 n=1 Tax=Nomia melanderi TaxID=2448451 RepID=UPI00130443BE|nr:inositol-trisphosphate 3-kinase homolog isoform X1 [Nomia melanderi]
MVTSAFAYPSLRAPPFRIPHGPCPGTRGTSAYDHRRSRKNPQLAPFKDTNPIYHGSIREPNTSIETANASRRKQCESLKKANDKKPSKKEQARLNHNSSQKEHRRQKDASSSTYSAFRQWRRSTSAGSNRSNSVGAKPTGAHPKLPNDPATIQKMEQFPMVLSDATMPEEDLSLKFLALNALDLTAPASDVLLKNRLKSWFQLTGHPDGFAPAGPGTVWKRKTGGAENTERIVYEVLSKDKELRDCIPRYYREVEYKGETFIELQNLLFGFNDPHVMDIKMGTRTFLESEVSKTTARPDLYQKMIAVDPNAPTKQEHEQRAVTKLRYMQFREQQSSTCSHGFRIEAMKLPGAPPITDLKKVKSHQEVLDTMKHFLGTREETRQKLLVRLKNLRSKIEASEYFKTHEVIGTSIFMIYNDDKVGVWLIDFAKTRALPNGLIMTHRKPWEQGNHEEGFLFGLDNLISTIEEVELSQAA